MAKHKIKKNNSKNKKLKKKIGMRKSNSISRNLPAITAKMQKTKKGFGFAIPEKKDGDDIFISERNMEGAMNGDIVEVGIYPDSRRTGNREGFVKRIIKRETSEIAGTFDRNKHFGFVVSDDRKDREEILIHKKHFNGARKGDKVLVKITRYPTNREGAEGKVTEIISRSGESDGDIRSLISP